MSPPSSSSARRHSQRLSIRDYHRDRAYDHTNGYGSHSRENDLDVKCGNFFTGDSIERLLKEDSTISSAKRDAFPVFECFATEISSSDAKKKLCADLRVIIV